MWHAVCVRCDDGVWREVCDLRCGSREATVERGTLVM